MSFLNGSYRYGTLGIGLGFPISSRLFLPNGSDNPIYDNEDFYPLISSSLSGTQGKFILLNSNSSDLGEDPAGVHTNGWVVGQNNKELAKTIINEFPRRMMQNLLLAPGVDGIPLPIAGVYFMKLLDHTPGTVEPLSALITDENGEIAGLTIVGNLSLSGGGDADIAINTFGKTNTIDAGTISDPNTIIKSRRSTLTEDEPPLGSLSIGELAINITDRKVWVGTGGETAAPVLIVDFYNSGDVGGTNANSGNGTLADGGTSASLTAVNGGIVYSTASAMAISAAGTAGQVLTSAGAAAPTWTAQSSLSVGTAIQATQLLNTRSIALGGEASGSTNFDGSTNVTITTTIPLLDGGNY